MYKKVTAALLHVKALACQVALGLVCTIFLFPNSLKATSASEQTELEHSTGALHPSSACWT